MSGAKARGYRLSVIDQALGVLCSLCTAVLEYIYISIEYPCWGSQSAFDGMKPRPSVYMVGLDQSLALLELSGPLMIFFSHVCLA